VLTRSAITSPIAVQRWLTMTVLAFAASLAHLFIDVHIGLFGPSAPEISPLQILNVALLTSIFTYWAWAMAYAQAGSASALATVVVFSAFWAAFANGAVALVVAPPPSLGFPYQDIAHGLSLVFGTLATFLAWPELKVVRSEVSYVLPTIAATLIIANLVVQGLLAL
jgi:hypothetical protein